MRERWVVQVCEGLKTMAFQAAEVNGTLKARLLGIVQRRGRLFLGQAVFLARGNEENARIAIRDLLDEQRIAFAPGGGFIAKREEAEAS
jgi:hypothetical protein